MSRPPAFDLVLVGYRPDDTREALRFCDEMLDPADGGRRVLVLNRPGLGAEIDLPSFPWDVVEGSNEMAEFSGWQEGLHRLQVDPVDAAGVVFVNDSVSTHRHFTLARSWAFRRTLDAGRSPSIVGFVDVPDRRAIRDDEEVELELEIAGHALEAWTSTYCFALNNSALQALGHELYDLSLVQECTPGGMDEDSFFGRLSPDLDVHLRHWMFGGGWYGSGPLTAENAARLQLKAQCCVAELLLSARCRTAGVVSKDPFWFHPRLARLDRVLQGIGRRVKRYVH